MYTKHPMWGVSKHPIFYSALTGDVEQRLGAVKVQTNSRTVFLHDLKRRGEVRGRAG